MLHTFQTPLVRSGIDHYKLFFKLGVLLLLDTFQVISSMAVPNHTSWERLSGQFTIS